MIFDEWLLIAANQKVGSYSKDESTRNFKSKITDYNIACLDVHVKQLTVEPAMMIQKDLLIAQVFNDEFCVVQEWLGPNQIQLMAVKKSKVEEIYQYCNPTPISSLVAYQVAMRAYLISQNLLNEVNAVIFVDDLKNMAVVTIFHGSKFSDSRQIVMRDVAYMTNEIKRTWGHFSVNINDDQKFVLMSNNKEWLNAFIELKLVSPSEILHVHAEYPALEGLKTAKFTNNFILPKDLAQKKRRRNFLQRMLDVSILIFFICLSGLVYGFFWVKEARSQEAIRIQKATLHELEKNLAEKYQKKLRMYIHEKQRFNWASIYADFITHVPYRYTIKEFSFRLDVNNQWAVSALIIPNTYDYYGDFVKTGVWQNAVIVNERVNNAMGERITLVFPSRGAVI